MNSPDRTSGEKTLPEKVLALKGVFEQSEIPFAFGGAIALAYHAEPRATDDIDVNILLSPNRGEEVVRALELLFDVPDRDERVHQIATRDQTRVAWGKTYVDLFFTDTAFHESLTTRIQTVDFGEAQVPIISAEDLVVCKCLFNRPHDWVDIGRISLIQGDELDRPYIDRWLRFFVGDDDPIIARFRQS